MTSDQKFLRENHIEPCEIQATNWMDWREEDIDRLRFAVGQQAELYREENASKQHWRAWAVLGWLFAALLFSIPIINRIGQ